MVDSQIGISQQNTVQDVKKGGDRARTYPLLPFLAVNNSFAPPWWSVQRDMFLRRFWRESDHLSGAMYTVQSRIASTPFIILPKDPTFSRHAKEADIYEQRLNYHTEFGRGWKAMVEPVVEDLFSQDNGAFIELIGDGDPNGPLTGPVITLSHLDSSCCTRTSDPEYPVIYRDPQSGAMYQLHYTRVIMMSQQPSAASRMNGVGLSAVSRCLNTAQHLMDVLINLQEQMGSRPMRGIMTTKGGLDPETIEEAFGIVNDKMDAAGYQRYSGIAIVGDPALPDAAVELTTLAGLPKDFYLEISYQTGMAIVALAFGIDPRELYPNLGQGSTRAEALLQHIKQRYKAIGQTLADIETAVNHYVLPPHLRMEFRFQDDAQERQSAEINAVRASRRASDLKIELTDPRTERELMLDNGEITAQQFEMLELNDGRMADGTSVLRLIVSQDPAVKKLVDTGVEEPLNVFAHEPELMLRLIMEKQSIILEEQNRVTGFDRMRLLKQCMGALQQLQEIYVARKEEIMAAQQQAAAGMPADPDALGPDEQSPSEQLTDVFYSQDDMENETGGAGLTFRDDQMGGNVQVGAQKPPSPSSAIDTLDDQITLQAALKEVRLTPVLGPHIIELPEWVNDIEPALVAAVLPPGLIAKAMIGLQEDEATDLIERLQYLGRFK